MIIKELVNELKISEKQINEVLKLLNMLEEEKVDLSDI